MTTNKPAAKKCVNQRMKGWHYVQCKVPAKVTRDGKDYCHNHDPKKAEVAKAGKNVTIMYVVKGDKYKLTTTEDLTVLKTQVTPHGPQNFKILDAEQLNPKSSYYGKPKGGEYRTIAPRSEYAPTLAEAFKKHLENSAKLVEEARVKADEETIRHDQETEMLQSMKVLLGVQ